MLTTIRNAWKIPELRRKLLFTLVIILLYRIGNVIPVPGVNVQQMSLMFSQQLSNTIFGLFDMMSGSAFSQATIFALSIQPYINASIIIQLLTIAIPALERLSKEGGEEGKKKLTKITRYTTVGLGVLMGFAYYIMLSNYNSQYSNMLLGKVQMCERYEDLKKYSVSITKGCMRYQNRVASAIKPEVFRVPFIGKNAFTVQLAQAEEEFQKLSETMENQEKKLSDTKEILGLLSTESDVDIKYRLDVIATLRMLNKSIDKCEENIRKLKENSTLIQKQLQLDELEKVLRGLDYTISSDTEKIGGMRARIQDLVARKQTLLEKQVTGKSEVTALAADAGERLNSWNREYKEALGVRSIEQFQSEYFYKLPSNKRKYNSERCQIAKDNMINAMVEYKTEHDFGAAASLDGFPEFEAVYERLKNSELLDYEEKVQSAHKAAETEFHEQFLAKLQENMKLAQGEFKELNKALKGIDFSSERYEFQFMPSKKYRNYYEMIMDDFNVTQGESLFSGIFHEAHKDVIEELFEQLSVSGDNSAQALDEFTDYRTYMDYDIKIIHNDGTYSYYSKVCEEKSGGETQTPFYVTVAASFVQLYSNNIGGEAAGLVLFDEAFNNMDDERIGGVLEFLRRLPLQLIIAAPPDKIQYIGPAMDEVMLVMTDQKQSYVEEYHNAV